MKPGRLELQLLYWTSRLVILFLLPLHISDMELYGSHAFKLVKEGLWPYRDFAFEYPPLAYLVVLLPGWVHHLLDLGSVWAYRLLFSAFILPFDFLLFRKFLREPPLPGSAFYYVFLTCLLPYLLFDRLDVIVGFLIAWPYLFGKGDRVFSWSWGLGGAVKLVPFLLLPFRLLDWRGRDSHRLFFFSLAPALLVILSFGLTAAFGKLSFLSHHSERGVQVESLGASLALSAQVAGFLEGGKVESNYGAQHLVGFPRLESLAKQGFWLALLLTLAALFCLGLRRRLDSLRAVWLLLLSFLAFGYVLSPQFLLWVLPLSFPVAANLERGRRKAFLAVFGLVVASTGLHFHFYWNYAELQPASVFLLLARNLLLLLLLGLSWKWLIMRRLSAFQA